jgi:hypothetical protein
MSDLNTQSRQQWKAALARTPECLSASQMEAVQSGARLDAKTKTHLDACPRCQTDLSLLESFNRATPLNDEGAGVAWIVSQLERQRQNSRSAAAPTHAAFSFRNLFDFRWALGFAAVAALLVAVGLVSLRGNHEPPLNASLGNGNHVYRSSSLSLIGPKGDLAAAPKQLQWETTSGAAKYHVQILEVDRTVLWQGDTTAANVNISPRVALFFKPGKTLLWQVTALDGNGQVIATSDSERIRVDAH